MDIKILLPGHQCHYLHCPLVASVAAIIWWWLSEPKCLIVAEAFLSKVWGEASLNHRYNCYWTPLFWRNLGQIPSYQMGRQLISTTQNQIGFESPSSLLQGTLECQSSLLAKMIPWHSNLLIWGDSCFGVLILERSNRPSQGFYFHFFIGTHFTLMLAKLLVPVTGAVQISLVPFLPLHDVFALEIRCILHFSHLRWLDFAS